MKIESGWDRHRSAVRADSAGSDIGTNATQAGFASARTPSPIVSPGRSVSGIANRNPAELSRFGTLRPLRFHPRKSYADPPRFVPGLMINMVCRIFINFT
jgi:hypothetical protein